MTNKNTVTTVSFTSYEHQVALSGPIEQPDHFLEEFKVIRNATENDTVRIFLNTPGGCVATGTQYRSVLLGTEATTIAHIESACHSAGTIIALSCDDLVVSDGAWMLIHNYSSGAWGKGTDLVKGVIEQDKWIKALMRSTYQHFLTEDEIENQLFKSDDIYLNADEIKERWERVLDAREIEGTKKLEELREQVREQVKSM